MEERAQFDQLTQSVIGAAIDVHRILGPGLLESAYEQCLAYEFTERGLPFEKQKVLSIQYKNITLDAGYRLDFLVGDKLIIELKSIDMILPIHKAQLLSYLRLSGCKLGLLINFNVKLLHHGIYRIANNLPEISIPPRALRPQR